MCEPIFGVDVCHKANPIAIRQQGNALELAPVTELPRLSPALYT